MLPQVDKLYLIFKKHTINELSSAFDIIDFSNPNEAIRLFFWNAQKTIVLYPNATFNATPVMGISKAAQNNWNPPPKVNIERATAICLQKKKFKKQIVAIWV